MWKRLLPYLLMLVVGTGIGMALSSTKSATDSRPTNTSAALCAEHGIAIGSCTRCDPSLIPRFQAAGDWCAEHHLPESQCDLCNPALREKGAARAQADGAEPQGLPAHSADDGHDHASHAKPAPLPDSTSSGVTVFFRSNQPVCPTDDAVIQFASVQTAERVGLSVAPVLAAPSTTVIEAPAEVVFDQTKSNSLTSAISLRIVRWQVEPGETVRAGQTIALAESPEAASLKAECVEACADALMHVKDLARKRELFGRGLVEAAALEVTVAETEAANARRRRLESELRLIGLDSADLARVHEQQELTPRFLLRTTTPGVVVERAAPLGAMLPAGVELVKIADPGALWIEARVRPTDLVHLRTGQPAIFTSDGGALDRVAGRVIWVAQSLDPVTRTGTVRMRPDAPAPSLQPGQFGRLDINPNSDSETILVPKDAVQWEGCCNIVFVQETRDRFIPRKVEIARGDVEHYRVTSGVRPGESVVTKGSFFLKTELKKGSIGAGCCGLEPTS